MVNLPLGRLESVHVREAWKTEAGDFTPWLAQEVNIKLLGDAVGLDLEVEAQEKNVGPFRADILCKDTATGSWVLVENQLERTDHTHLGQLLTYAAGLQAVTIIWVAARFTEEHRAALDWLNGITGSDFNFFGLEVELWRIGDSPVAPKFNVISKPNDWKRSVSGAANQALTETQKLQLDYWTEFRKLLEEKGGVVRPTKPQPWNWVTFSIGRSDFWLTAYMNTQRKEIGAYVGLTGDYAKPHFHLLRQNRAVHDAQFGESLDWQEMPDKKESRIAARWLGADPTDRDKWGQQHAWLYDKLQRFHATFSQPIKQLDASAFTAEVAEACSIPASDA